MLEQASRLIYNVLKLKAGKAIQLGLFSNKIIAGLHLGKGRHCRNISKNYQVEEMFFPILIGKPFSHNELSLDL